MANRRWLGKAKQVQQVTTVTIANTWTAADTITITIDNVEFVVTIGSLITTDQVATTLKQAFNGEAFTDTTASCSPTFSQGGAQAINQLYGIVATVSSSVVSLTGIAGIPFTVSVTESTASTGTATGATATAATGKWFWDNADNWSGNAVPVDNDTVIFDDGDVDCRYNLTAAMQPALVVVTKNYRGKIGLPETNVDNAAKPYAEYRTKNLTFDDNSVTCTYQLFEDDGGQGSPLVRIDAGAGQSIFNVYGAGARTAAGYPNLLLLGTHTSNVVNAAGGDVGIAFFQGDASNLATIRATGNATVVCGDGVTFTASAVIDITGATVQIASATSSSGDIDINDNGKLIVVGTAAHNDIDVQNGVCDYRSSGTLTTLRVGSSGLFDRSKDLRAMTVTNLVNTFKGARIKDPNKTMTLTAGYKTNGYNPDSNLDFGTDRTYTIA